MIDNFEILKKLLHFDKTQIYQISVLQRSKDGHPKSTKTITDFFVNSEEYFDFIKPAIKVLCDTYNARAYLNLNGKSQQAVVWKMIDSLIDHAKTGIFKPIPTLVHATASVNANNKFWVVDVDDLDVNLEDVVAEINNCQSGFNTNVIEIVPTVNGYHIITKPFNVTQLTSANLEIKKNSPTLLYYNG